MRYRVRRFFTPPVFLEDEEMTRISRVLNTLFVAESVVIVIGMATILFLFVNKVGTSLLLGMLLARMLIARALAQRGLVRQASLLWLAGIWLMTSLTVLLTGRIGTTLVTFHLAILVITGILLGKQPAILIATLSSLLFLGMAILETTGYHLVQYLPASPLTQWFALVMAIIFTLFPLSLNIQGFVDVLDRIRKSEQRYANLFDTAPVMYLILHDNGGVLIIAACNAAFLTTLDYRPDQVLGQPLTRFYFVWGARECPAACGGR